MEKEYRSIRELRSADCNKIEGYAVVFNSESQWLGGFFEEIAPEALDEATIANSDIFANINHDEDKVLARRKYGNGNLELSLDEHGMKFSFPLLDNELSRTAKSYIDANIIDSCSFAFTVAKDEWTTDENGIDHRRILKIDRLFDIALCYNGAYQETEVSCRSYDKYKEEKSKQSDIQNLCDEILAME